MDNIVIHKQKIKAAKAERDTATGYRRKDLDRYVKRLEQELRIYIRYQRG